MAALTTHRRLAANGGLAIPSTPEYGDVIRRIDVYRVAALLCEEAFVEGQTDAFMRRFDGGTNMHNLALRKLAPLPEWVGSRALNDPILSGEHKKNQGTSRAASPECAFGQSSRTSVRH